MDSDLSKGKKGQFSSDGGPSSKRRKLETCSQEKMEEKESVLETPIVKRLMCILLNIVYLTIEGLIRERGKNSEFSKGQILKEFSQNIDCVLLKHTEIDSDAAHLLKLTVDHMMKNLKAQKNDTTETLAKLGNNVESECKKLWEEILKIEWVEIVTKTIEANFKEESNWELIIAEFEKIKENIKQKTLTKYEFIPSQEHLINENLNIHYYIASNQFHKMLAKMTNAALPKKHVINSYDAIESITYVHNGKLEAAYANQKETFKKQKRVDQNGNVKELFLFHGTSMESIESIITNNFHIDCFPQPEGEREGEGQRRKKAMLFGRGIYFSKLPAVSLMYGSGLLLCKVIVGSCEIFRPMGEIPPDIPNMFDSREVIKDGVGVVHVVKKPSQILPYCIIKLRKESLLPMAKAITAPTHPLQVQAYQPIIKKSIPNHQKITNSFGVSSFQNCAIYGDGVLDNTRKLPLNGEMSWTKNSRTIPGYPNCGTIIITYKMMCGIQTVGNPHPGKPYHAHGFPRTAFLPDNQKGNVILKMLLTAFRRSLTFAVGTSTEQEDYIVWNGIHHKTKLIEDGEGHGYPDMEYIDKVAGELENIGVKQE